MIYCGKYGCDKGVVWMMSEFPVPCEDCRKLREATKRHPLWHCDTCRITYAPGDHCPRCGKSGWRLDCWP